MGKSTKTACQIFLLKKILEIVVCGQAIGQSSRVVINCVNIQRSM